MQVNLKCFYEFYCFQVMTDSEADRLGLREGDQVGFFIKLNVSVLYRIDKFCKI